MTSCVLGRLFVADESPYTVSTESCEIRVPRAFPCEHLKVVLEFGRKVSGLELITDMEVVTTGLLCVQLEFRSGHRCCRMSMDKVIDVTSSKVVLANSCPSKLMSGLGSAPLGCRLIASRPHSETSEYWQTLLEFVKISVIATESNSHVHIPTGPLPRMFECCSSAVVPDPITIGQYHWSVHDKCLIGVKGSISIPSVPYHTQQVFDTSTLPKHQEVSLLREIMNKTLGCHARVHDIVLESIIQYTMPRLFQGHTYLISSKETPIVVTLKPHHTTFILDQCGHVTLTLRN